MTPDDYFYEAERVLHVMQYPELIADPQGYYDYITGTIFFGNRWPAVVKKNVVVKVGGYRSPHAYADLTNHKIFLPSWATNSLTILHEISHLCTPRCCDHGPAFRRAEIDLVTHFIGREAGQALRHSCLAFGLEVPAAA